MSRTSVPQSGNFVDYARHELDTLAQRPLCAVDSLILGWMSYFRIAPQVEAARTWEGVDVRELLRAEDFEVMFGDTWDPDGCRDLLFAVAANPRFRGMRVCGFREVFDAESAEQFAAVTFRLPDGALYVSFRGTDSSIVGWKEDFNMAFMSPVPSQVEAAGYLEEAARALEGPLFVGGHSKGGNLAVYAASMLAPELQDRVVRVFSHDGPGFTNSFLSSDGFLRVRDKVDKTMPRSSVFGMLFENQEEYEVVESTSFALLQHNPFSWIVDGTSFRFATGISAGARYFDATLSAWLASVTPEQRGRFIDALFSVFERTDATYFAEIRDNLADAAPRMLEAAGEIDADTRKFLLGTIAALVKIATIDTASNATGKAIARVEAALPTLPRMPELPKFPRRS